MRQIILLIFAAVALVGCGKKDPPAQLETEPEPKPAARYKPTAAEPIPAEKAAAIKKASEEAQAKAFTNSLGMKFVPVPGTEVQFCIWETRVKDYAAYAAVNAEVNGSWKDFGYGFKQKATYPVVNVSWNEAQAFCDWLTKRELAEGKIKVRQKYRLPTDTEWSVVVGLGKEKGNIPEEKDEGIKDFYPWGKGWPQPKESGNYSQSIYKVDNFVYTSPVGSFAANELGVHDLGGNVWEWCEDKWNPTSKGRVMRRASWYNDTLDILLSSSRAAEIPDGHDNTIGFRCVLANE